MNYNIIKHIGTLSDGKITTELLEVLKQLIKSIIN